VNRGCVAFEDI